VKMIKEFFKKEFIKGLEEADHLKVTTIDLL
jgi:hypothetical protein